MNKLFKLKVWVTLEEAAEHLALVLSEPVSVTDIFRLALNRHLTISMNLVNGHSAKMGRMMHIDEAPFRVVPGLLQTAPAEYTTFPREGTREEQLKWSANNSALFESGQLVFMTQLEFTQTDGVGYLFEKKITSIDGIWDLPLLGAEVLDVEHALCQLTGGPEVTGVHLDGTLLVSPDGQRFAWLQEHFSENKYCKGGSDREKYPWSDPKSYYPAGGLPPDEIFVIRTDALSNFVRSITLEQDSVDSTPRELRSDARQNYERVIACLWAKAHGDGGVGKLSSDPYTAARSLATLLAGHGLESPSEDKIGRVLTAAKGHGLPIGS